MNVFLELHTSLMRLWFMCAVLTVPLGWLIRLETQAPIRTYLMD
jgi:hypothetical protein